MRISVLLCMVVLLAACNKKAKKLADEGLPAAISAKALLMGIEKQLYAPEVMELKGDMRVQFESLSNLKLNAIVRVDADSVVWFSVRKFGFEGGRGLATNDSIWVLNRMQREAILADANELRAGVSGLPVTPSLENLVAIFGGKPIGDWRKADVARTPTAYSLTSVDYPGASLDIASASKLPERWRYQDSTTFGEIQYGDYRMIEGKGLFPFFRSISFSDQPGDTSRLEFVLTSLTEHETLAYPFSIPSSYTRTDF